MDKKDQEKKGRLLDFLDKGMVMIHLDARRPGVLVPADLAKEAHLRLNLSYRFDPQDMTIGEWGIRATLSFGGSRFKVAVPWSALFAITSYETQEPCMYPDDMPKELVQAAMVTVKTRVPETDDGTPKPRAILRQVVMDGQEEAPPEDEPPKPAGKGHLRLVK